MEGTVAEDAVAAGAEKVTEGAQVAVDKAAELARAGVPLGAPIPRDLVADQILRETLLTVSSDWPFMVSKDSAADYARYRAGCGRDNKLARVWGRPGEG